MTGFRLDGSTNADNGFLQSIPDAREGQRRLAVVRVARQALDVADRDALWEMLGLADVATKMLAGAEDEEATSLPADGPTTGSTSAA